MEIFNTNRTLFYYLFAQHLEEFNPIVYDPTIADTIEGYSDLFVDPNMPDILISIILKISKQLWKMQQGTVKFVLLL